MIAAGAGERPLRGAMLGTGSISIYHMRAWQAVPSVTIVALANRTRSRAQALGQPFGVGDDHIYTDYRELLQREQLDFVDIATAPAIHAEQAMAAAARGVHVFCQKPLATSLEEAQQMIAACAQAGVRCVVNENWRWRRWYRGLKTMLDEGRIGEPFYAHICVRQNLTLPLPDGSLSLSMQRQPYMAGMPRLILYEWGIHLLDTLRFLFGEIASVYARMARVSPLVQGEDVAAITLGFHSGLTAVVDISWASYTPPTKPRLGGSVEPMLVEGKAGSIELDPYHGDVISITTAAGTELRAAHSGQTPAEAYQECFTNAHRHFIGSLRCGQPAETEAHDNLKTLAATFAAYESAAKGQVVFL